MFSTSDEMTKSEIESAIISAKEFIAKAENEEAKARYNAQLSFLRVSITLRRSKEKQ